MHRKHNEKINSFCKVSVFSLLPHTEAPNPSLLVRGLCPQVFSSGEIWDESGKLKINTGNPFELQLYCCWFFYLNTTTVYKITLGTEEKKKYTHLDYLHNLHEDDKNTLGRQMVIWGVTARNPGTQTHKGFPTFPCGNSIFICKRTTNSMMEHEGFGLGSALAWLKSVIPLLIPLHSHPQHPFLFLILSWWQLKIPPHSFLQVFFIFFKLKNVKPSEVHSLKITFIWLIFTISTFFFF